MGNELCPCGYAGDPTRVCTCAEGDIQRYRSRLSGPLLDRIDLHLVVSPVSLRLLGASAATESSADVRARVEAARALKVARTIADLAALERIAAPQMAEALRYRPKLGASQHGGRDARD